MKKLLLGFSVLLLFFALLIPHAIILAKENSEVNSISSNPQDATKSAEKINYELPYPGILPDNPLYFLKAVRDRIISFIISDPVKKAEFHSLTSDKRISASLMLAEKSKPDLAISTLSKGNNYFHKAIGNTSEAKRMGKNVDTVLHNMEKAIKRHQEVLEMVKSKVGKEFSSQLQIETKRMAEFENSVNQLTSE